MVRHGLTREELIARAMLVPVEARAQVTPFRNIAGAPVLRLRGDEDWRQPDGERS
jgi:hypothetical protein